MRTLILLAMLATVMFVSKKLMEVLPNIHLVGMLTICYTVVFRLKALIPIYIYVFLDGLFLGFSPYWIPNLYAWTVLWALAMLIPKGIPKKAAAVIYPALCAFHGLIFGALNAPVWAILHSFDFRETLTWMISGLTFDILHLVGNLAAGMLVLPLSELMKKLLK